MNRNKLKDETGILVISLDFELLWGVFDKVDWRHKIVYFENTRKVIPEILKLFEEYGISCTWATVGMLFNSGWEEWNHNIPSKLPNYDDNKLSAYDYGKSIQNKETEELCFAPNLIRLIKDTSGQEIATHTYSHYYCLEPGQTMESFRLDLQKASRLAKKFDIDLKSLVFPRNQYNKEYLNLCSELGINTVRINPENWYWKNTHKDSLEKKIFRTGDAYFGLNNKTYKENPKISSGVTGQRASRLLRPNCGKPILDKIRINRVRSEMITAAKKKEIYHLWWHPHNFGGNPHKSIQELKYILEEFRKCQSKFGFQSLSMKEVL